ncbi:MAG TPA: ThuA domain-containing protein [Chthoniobacteraceae bacterium]|jgi:type 1 glutamine amidotransferase
MKVPLPFVVSLASCLLAGLPAEARTADGKQKLVLIAGKPSHPPRMHEFRAGALLLQQSLAKTAGLVVEVHDMGWVKDEKTFDDADAVVIYADGGPGHPAVQGDHLAKIDALVKKGVGFGCMHYGVEVVPENGGPQFKQWIGGYYEGMYSCNPIWEPSFDSFPHHPITRGVKPFKIKDEWYFNIRFADPFSAEKRTEEAGVTFTPLLVAKPSDEVRNGPYVYPKGPYPHIQQAKGRKEAMMWCVERRDGGRGFGFTGGHFHDNWANEEFRKTVLNALAWVAKAEVPADGISSSVTKEQIDANLDPKDKK